MYIHCVYKMTFKIKYAIFLKTLDISTFVAKMSYYAKHNIWIIQYNIFLHNQTCKTIIENTGTIQNVLTIQIGIIHYSYRHQFSKFLPMKVR